MTQPPVVPMFGRCTVHDVPSSFCAGPHARYVYHHAAGYAALVDLFAGLVLLGILAIACAHLPH